MDIIINWIITTLVILVVAFVLPGIQVAGFTTALLVALVLGVLNLLVRPVLILLTLPINILTLGLFTFVINALLIMLASYIIPGFEVKNFWWAVIFSIILALTIAIVDAVF
ncbi:MAG: hypothetical protein A2365_03075 [Candidatus Nealsonbacteria bacterium RIFOXYB1_FULL_40_15]|uniref:Phage holin family protein n=1 Tax=Candidatus Nealsonbacteria bacterium RIFOXYB1_FULL_40_15 TaxID=1801677 RepID=A0A1G2EPF4_9BACT|nr:MAG: hypothetical protein A2365_03075 [Candidatus Nealsonbacteria bacterium RIFOXYB1_FULL_40_15]OGZ29892.1 MAG: hypothetical protein A2562_02110 [Candidatus Nealsonbacteria bacterium RIFOXYD1_FULL_39_11]